MDGTGSSPHDSYIARSKLLYDTVVRVARPGEGGESSVKLAQDTAAAMFLGLTKVARPDHRPGSLRVSYHRTRVPFLAR